MPKHFVPSEFSCKCGECGVGLGNMNKDMINALYYARKKTQIPFVLTSAARCLEHSKDKSRIPYTSEHVVITAFDMKTVNFELGWNDIEPCECLAVDIACDDVHNRHTIIKALIEEGFNDIGIANGFIHAGFLRNSSAESKIYTYSNFRQQ